MSSTSKSPKLMSNRSNSISSPSTTGNNSNARSFEKSAFIFLMGCLFGMQLLNFQNSHDGTLSGQHHDESHYSPTIRTPDAGKDLSRDTTNAIPQDELKSLIRSELLDLLQETKAELASAELHVRRRQDTAAKIIDKNNVDDEEEKDDEPESTDHNPRQDKIIDDNNVEDEEEKDDEPESTDDNRQPDAPETIWEPKAAPPIPSEPESDDDTSTTTTALQNIPKMPEPLVQPFTYTQEDGARNLKWKQLGRDWRLDDPKEKKVWDRLAAEQRTLWSDANGAPPQTYDNVALVSKVHSSSPFVGSVVQNMCLVKAAYNYDRKYPWIIFTTIPWKAKALERAKRWAYPANFTVVVDSEPLHEVLGSMTQDERAQLEARCECCHKTNCCKDPSKLHWDWWCHEHGAGHATLSYLWQAEFRATHLWNHPALKDIKHMIWIDNDALPTKPWPRDPLTTMVENDLVVMYDNFPQGSCGNSLLIEKMKMAYDGRAVCKLELTKDGHFKSIPCKEDQNKLTRFGLIHGMFHITNLDVYRDPVNLEMNRLLTQHKGYKFSRQWDDQIAVTVVPAMVAPERAWDMRKNGFNMSMAHNGNLDGKEKNIRWSYTIWWKYFNHTWPLASRMCNDVMTFAG